MAAMISVENLVKRYPKRPVNAVDGVSFVVARGEVFGLLGPNGAGKTTTIGVLTTRVRPTSGRARIDGIDVMQNPSAAKREFAVVPQRNNLDRALTARRNLLFHAAYFGMSPHERERRADALLDEFGLGDRGGDKVDNYSGGMAQRLMIARAMMHDPDVLFLDEPTTGLDPQARLFVWDRIREMNARGLTILLTTHDMDEAEELCGRVAIMDHGRILAMDTPEVLRRLVPGASSLEVHVSYPRASDGDMQRRISALIGDLQGLPGVERVERITRDVTAPALAPAGLPWVASGAPGTTAQEDRADLGVVRVYADSAAALIAQVASAVGQDGCELVDLHVSRASLEDVFIHLTGRALR